MEEKKQNYLLSASILIAALLVAGALIYSTGVKNINQGGQKANIQETVQGLAKPQIDDEAILGNPQAPVTIVVFSDYQCPFWFL